MRQAVASVRTVAGFLPGTVRATIYSCLGAAMALESIWGVIPEQVEAKLIATVGALGFGVAALNTKT